MAIAYHVVVPFGRGENGDPVPLEPMEAPNAESARRRASTSAAQLADALVDARQADADARADVERQVAAVSAGYLDPQDKRDRARMRRRPHRQLLHRPSACRAHLCVDFGGAR